MASSSTSRSRAKLHDGPGVGARGVEDHDALFRAGGQGDVVDTGAGPGYGQQVFRQLHFMHIGAADGDGITGVQIIGEGIVVCPQGGTLGRNFVQIMDTIHGFFLFYLFSFSNVSMKAASF